MLDEVVAALLLLVAADAGIYVSASRGAASPMELRAEVVMFMATAVAIIVAALLGGRMGAGAVLAIIAARCAWDALHIGASCWIDVDLDGRYPPASLVVKGAAAAVVVLFALPS